MHASFRSASEGSLGSPFSSTGGYRGSRYPFENPNEAIKINMFGPCQVVWKIGALQKYVVAIGTSDDYGPSAWDSGEVSDFWEQVSWMGWRVDGPEHAAVPIKVGRWVVYFIFMMLRGAREARGLRQPKQATLDQALDGNPYNRKIFVLVGWSGNNVHGDYMDTRVVSGSAKMGTWSQTQTGRMAHQAEGWGWPVGETFLYSKNERMYLTSSFLAMCLGVGLLVWAQWSSSTLFQLPILFHAVAWETTEIFHKQRWHGIAWSSRKPKLSPCLDHLLQSSVHSLMPPQMQQPQI